MYAGLDPQYQDRSFLSSLGNPNLNPEVNISYEVGYKTLLGSRLGWTINAFNNNRFDYIVSRRVITTDATGRPVTKTMYINQDYAKIIGIETQLNARLNDHFNSFLTAPTSKHAVNQTALAKAPFRLPRQERFRSLKNNSWPGTARGNSTQGSATKAIRADSVLL